MAEAKDAYRREYEQYVAEHPELKQILNDFLADLLLKKPDDVYGFAKEYFSMMSSMFAKKPTKIRPLVLSGPSGAGKSTLVKRLMAEFPNAFGFSVSHTTRAPRPGETHGKEYYFTTMEDMQRDIEAGKFIEHANVYGKLYGTSIMAVETVMAQRRICLLDVDVQGVRSIKRTNLDPRCVFIMPPSLEELEKRLRARGDTSEEDMQRRLATAKSEIAAAESEGLFDAIIVNDDLESAYAKLRDLVREDALHVLQLQKESGAADAAAAK